MAVRPIITVPDPFLRQVSTPVPEIDDELRALMQDMLDSMYAAGGIGLAAIQIGVPKRVIVMDLARDGEPAIPRYFVNPQILELGTGQQMHEEGCLSVPGINDEVARPDRALVSYLDYSGQQITEWAEGLYAVCIQHEMDHLQGVLFIDHLSRLKRELALSKLRKSKRRRGEAA